MGLCHSRDHSGSEQNQTNHPVNHQPNHPQSNVTIINNTINTNIHDPNRMNQITTDQDTSQVTRKKKPRRTVKIPPLKNPKNLPVDQDEINKNNPNNPECILCFDNIICTLQECGHACFCAVCYQMYSKKFNICAVCYQPLRLLGYGVFDEEYIPMKTCGKNEIKTPLAHLNTITS